MFTQARKVQLKQAFNLGQWIFVRVRLSWPKETFAAEFRAQHREP